jgi:PAS domain S-box-containing protein
MQFEPPESQIGYQNGSQIPASEQMFRLLVSSVKDYAIFMLSPEGRILTWNEGAQRAKGYTADEVIGRHFSMFYTQEAKDSGHADNELRIAASSGRYEEEGWRVRKDGSMFWASVVITALFQDGKLVGFAKVTRDLSERKKAEIEREQALAALAKTNEDLQRSSRATPVC